MKRDTVIILFVQLLVAIVLLIWFQRPKPSSNDFDQIQAELIRLRQKIDRLPQHMGSAPLSEGVSLPFEEGTSASSDQPEFSGSREATVQTMAAQLQEMRNAMGVQGFLPPTEVQLEAAKQRIFNPENPVAEKLGALRLLRRADERTDEVVLEMIKVFRETEDPRSRADIFRQLDGVTAPDLKLPLLEAVAHEEEAEVRSEAAETLAHYKEDPDVRAWLEYLAESDPDEDVREEAQRSLRDH